MNKDFREFLVDELRQIKEMSEDIWYGYEAGVNDSYAYILKKYDEFHKPVVIPDFVADWIEEMKQDERPLYSVMSSLMNKTNHEWAVWKNANKDFSEIVAQAWSGGFTVEEVPLYHALVKGHELVTDEGDIACKYWNLRVPTGDVFPSNRYSRRGEFVIKMSKSEWNKLGINDSNADFVEVDGY